MKRNHGTHTHKTNKKKHEPNKLNTCMVKYKITNNNKTRTQQSKTKKTSMTQHHNTKINESLKTKINKPTNKR